MVYLIHTHTFTHTYLYTIKYKNVVMLNWLAPNTAYCYFFPFCFFLFFSFFVNNNTDSQKRNQPEHEIDACLFVCRFVCWCASPPSSSKSSCSDSGSSSRARPKKNGAKLKSAYLRCNREASMCSTFKQKKKTENRFTILFLHLPTTKNLHTCIHMLLQKYLNSLVLISQTFCKHNKAGMENSIHIHNWIR